MSVTDLITTDPEILGGVPVKYWEARFIEDNPIPRDTSLPPEARAELAERLIASLAADVSPEITETQLAELRDQK
jgi:hypothetical protein